MDDTLDLRDYLAVLRRRRGLVLLVTLVTVVTAIGVSLLQTPSYESTVEILIEPVRRSEDATLEALLLGESVIETERRVVASRSVAERVLVDLGLDLEPSELTEMVTTSIVRDARVIELTAADTDPERATAIANSFAAAYFDHRRDRAVDELLAAQGELTRRADDLREQIAQIDAQMALTTDDTALQQERASLAAQLAQVEASTIVGGSPQDLVRGGGEVLKPAEVPTDPTSPRPLRTGVLALVLGLMLGVGLAFLRDHLDDGIRGDEDVRRLGGGLPILGRIAHWTDHRADERLMTLVDPHDLVSEEFRALSANVRFALVGGVGGARPTAVRPSQVPGQVPGQMGGRAVLRQQAIVITSANPGEGKSSTAGNLAVAAALAGLRVLLVEADLRQPTLSERFGFPTGRGVSDLLIDPDLVGADGAVSQDLVRSHLIDVGIEGLRLLPAGTVPPNPTELLASPRMRVLHETLRQGADLVVFDAPPLLPVADTLEVAALVDSALVVVRPGACRRRELADALERLTAIGASVGGFIVNDVENVGAAAYGYGYRRATYRPRPAEVAPAPAPWSATSSPAPSTNGSGAKPAALWGEGAAAAPPSRDPDGA